MPGCRILPHEGTYRTSCWVTKLLRYLVKKYFHECRCIKLNNRFPFHVSTYVYGMLRFHIVLQMGPGGGWGGNSVGGAWTARGSCSREHMRYADCRSIKVLRVVKTLIPFEGMIILTLLVKTNNRVFFIALKYVLITWDFNLSMALSCPGAEGYNYLII